MKLHAMILSAAVSLIGFGASAQTTYDDDRPTDDTRSDADRPIDQRSDPAPMTATEEAIDDAEATRGRIAEAREEDRAQTDRRRPPSWIGIGFSAGGGVGGFFDDQASAATSAQGLWQVRAVVGTRTHFAGEMAYVGGATTLNTFGVENDATLTTNGFEGAFRWNVLTGLIQPYASAGLGYQHYSLGNAEISTSDVSSAGEVLTFPLALGVAWKPGAFVLDGRVSFKPATNSALMRDTNMSTWDVGAHAGFEF